MLFLLGILSLALFGCRGQGGFGGGEKVKLEQIFSGGSYQCTVQTAQGPVVMKVKDTTIRYEMETAQGRYSAIVQDKGQMMVSYSYIPDQDKWLKIAVPKAEAVKTPQQQAGIITKESAAQYPNYDCRKASISEEEFEVPEEKVLDYQELLEELR